MPTLLGTEKRAISNQPKRLSYTVKQVAQASSLCLDHSLYIYSYSQK